jgi:nitroimidazol reductase NimA-like FMN-containing flavoprotein (pyridoxamine 5'-phosphate oxidase superfamily)
MMTSFGLETLSEQECETLLANHAFGRVAVWAGEHPAVLPVLYRMFEGDVVFRTAPGEKLIAAVLGQEIVFEIDGVEPARRTGWSVNVVGRAEHIVDPVEKQKVAQLGLEPWAGDYRDEYVRLRTEHASGRRIRSDTGALSTGP